MCALLSRHGMVSADAAQVQRLQRALQQRDSELKLLNTKMEKMKREPVRERGREREGGRGERERDGRERERERGREKREREGGRRERDKGRERGREERDREGGK